MSIVHQTSHQKMGGESYHPFQTIMALDLSKVLKEILL